MEHIVLQKGFNYAKHDNSGNTLIDSAYLS